MDSFSLVTVVLQQEAIDSGPPALLSWRVSWSKATRPLMQEPRLGGHQVRTQDCGCRSIGRVTQWAGKQGQLTIYLLGPT